MPPQRAKKAELFPKMARNFVGIWLNSQKLKNLCHCTQVYLQIIVNLWAESWKVYQAFKVLLCHSSDLKSLEMSPEVWPSRSRGGDGRLDPEFWLQTNKIQIEMLREGSLNWNFAGILDEWTGQVKKKRHAGLNRATLQVSWDTLVRYVNCKGGD